MTRVILIKRQSNLCCQYVFTMCCCFQTFATRQALNGHSRVHSAKHQERMRERSHSPAPRSYSPASASHSPAQHGSRASTPSRDITSSPARDVTSSPARNAYSPAPAVVRDACSPVARSHNAYSPSPARARDAYSPSPARARDAYSPAPVRARDAYSPVPPRARVYSPAPARSRDVYSPARPASNQSAQSTDGGEDFPCRVCGR